MSPARRSRLLIHVNRHGRLSGDATPEDKAQLIEQGYISHGYTMGQLQLTHQGAIAAVHSGPIAMRPSNGTDAA